jgi:hypothetical protein
MQPKIRKLGCRAIGSTSPLSLSVSDPPSNKPLKLWNQISRVKIKVAHNATHKGKRNSVRYSKNKKNLKK